MVFSLTKHLQEGSAFGEGVLISSIHRWTGSDYLLAEQNHFSLQSGRGAWRRRQWHSTPVLLPGKSHGRRSLVGCSSWGCEESEVTERLHFHFSLSCIGEGNGNPLQCPCLENPRDGGAWWAAIYGVTQSQTRLKQLSSRSSSRGAGSFKRQAIMFL